MDQSPIATDKEVVPLKEFLETIPPGSQFQVISQLRKVQYTSAFNLTLPSIEIYCTSPKCGGTRFFDTEDSAQLTTKIITLKFATYGCRNCKRIYKTFALRLLLNENEKTITAFKFGETPAFGLHTSRKILDITGDEEEYFLKGRQSENQGLGIAAFAYYRRVVENQKNKILDEIIRVSEALSAPEEMLADFKHAKNEKQFSKAIESIKHGIPQALLIQGHNPLTLLHDALSEGLHAQSDEDCLSIATSIRTILGELVDKLANSLKDKAELNAAVAVLLKARAARAANKEK